MTLARTETTKNFRGDQKFLEAPKSIVGASNHPGVVGDVMCDVFIGSVNRTEIAEAFLRLAAPARSPTEVKPEVRLEDGKFKKAFQEVKRKSLVLTPCDRLHVRE